MSTAKAFEDTSIFQQIVEWIDFEGQSWRAEWSQGIWKVSKINGGVVSFFRSVGGAKNWTPKKIHAEAQK